MGSQQPPHIGYCDGHQKRLYSTRNLARDAIRRHHTKGMRPYRCNQVAKHWHIGHLPPAVRTGRKTAPEIYGGAR